MLLGLSGKVDLESSENHHAGSAAERMCPTKRALGARTRRQFNGNMCDSQLPTGVFSATIEKHAAHAGPRRTRSCQRSSCRAGYHHVSSAPHREHCSNKEHFLESQWPVILGYCQLRVGYFGVAWPMILGNLAFQAEGNGKYLGSCIAEPYSVLDRTG